MPFDIPDRTTKLVNGWIEETTGLPMTLVFSRLGLLIARELEAAYKAGAASTPDERMKTLRAEFAEERDCDLEDCTWMPKDDKAWVYHDARAEAFGIAVQMLSELLPSEEPADGAAPQG